MTSLRILLYLLALSVSGCPGEVTPADAPAVDLDGDGVPDDVDCDPTAPTVGRVGDRLCAHECGDAFQECTDGLWSTCVPVVECRCMTEGERRIAPCGNCGEESQECMGGRWMAVSMCLNSGCTPGAVESRSGTYCLVEQRLCGMDCQWSDWSAIRPMGTCTPGEAHCIPGALDWYCNDECMRVEDDPCCPPMDPPFPGCL